MMTQSFKGHFDEFKVFESDIYLFILFLEYPRIMHIHVCALVLGEIKSFKIDHSIINLIFRMFSVLIKNSHENNMKKLFYTQKVINSCWLYTNILQLQSDSSETIMKSIQTDFTNNKLNELGSSKHLYIYNFPTEIVTALAH